MAGVHGAMKKFLELELYVDSSLVDDQSILSISVPPGSLKDWLLGLLLIQDKLVEACVFGDDTAHSKLEVQLGTSCEWKAGSQSGHFMISLTESALGYLIGFFARYYRDGVSEVDHIDIESINPTFGYITIHASEHSRPLSSEEVKRRLGIE
jgi:hypothetical protein